jgi:ADP-heptose:LPS heptosyltransferase/glycosyltransferase involved in cell wall biosynthesis
MRKIKTLFKAPVLTSSGYGVHSRQIFQGLFSDPEFDLYVENINWGHTPFLTEESEIKNNILTCVEKRIIEKHKGNDNFDLFVHVTVPNEFERKGTFCIGVSAMVETDRVSHQWVQKCNEMDLIIVPSEHSKNVLEKTTIDWENQKTGERGSLKFQKPVIVCSEGVNTSIFHKFGEEIPYTPKIKQLDFDSEFNFLHIGQWGKGTYGEDRKNVALLVKYLIEAFKGRQDVGLVLKLNMARNSTTDHRYVLQRLREIKSNFKKEEVPPIYLVHGNLSDNEVAALYNHPKIKSFISLTHGEGFGLPLLEAAACELPIIATNWSGHLDFLKKGKFSAVKYELKEVPQIAVWDPIVIKGSRWAEVDEEDTKHRMKKMVSSYHKPKEWAKDLAETIKDEFSTEVTNQNFVDVVKMALTREDAAPKINPLEHLQAFVDTPDSFNVIYTMPMSTGDVFISTAVIDGLVKELPKNAKIYFATDPKYADVLEDNPHIYKVIPWNQTMIQTDLLEDVFDLALMPNMATQFTFSNYVRRGQGRLLAEEFANYCQCELGEYHIKKDHTIIESLPDGYVTLHAGSGKGQWEARKYIEWEEVVKNLRSLYPDMKIVQVGSGDEPLVNGVDVDMRGKTTIHQLASVILVSRLHLSIDTFTMHLAAALKTPVVSLFGSSHAMSSGPWVKDRKKSKIYLLEASQKLGCNKACYKYQCKKNREMPCINEIDPRMVVEAVARIVDKEAEGPYERQEGWEYAPNYKPISGYTTTYNLKGYPFVESIKSMLGFCDEVVVVDGESDDGTYEVLEKLAQEDERIKLFQNKWDLEEPGMDGLQKAFARALCDNENEFLWQQDCDEVVHEDDYEKIRMIAKRFPTEADILHLPIIELWGNEKTVTGRRHAWKWRMSRNKPEITHGINKEARLVDEETGKIYAKRGMSDGCEYINVMTGDMLPHVGFWSQNIDVARRFARDQYAGGINQIFQNLPSIFHYSWCSLENKVQQFKTKWDRQWNVLYQTDNVERFPEAKTKEDETKLIQKLFEEGGEDSDDLKYKFELKRSNPAIMKKWIEENVK